MFATNNSKILAIGLAAALLGGSVGALVSRSTAPKASEPVVAATSAPQPTPQATPQTTDQQGAEALTPEQAAYRDGFAEGFRMGRETVEQPRSAVGATRSERIVYRSVPVSSSRRVYYDYRRDNRSFWDKHRDKLTVAIGTGVGAAVGGAIGGKKGALIGALAGAGGSALYTYKLRKRDDR
jgi:hypothetical protein